LSWGTKAVTSTGKAHASGDADKAAARVNSRRARAAEMRSADSPRAGRSRRAQLERALSTSGAREASSAAATMLSSMQVVLCLALAIVNYALKLRFSRYLFFVGAALSSLGFFIMCASFAYFIRAALMGSHGTLAHRANALFTFASWVAIAGAAAALAIVSESSPIYRVAGVIFIGTYSVFGLLALRFALFPSLARTEL
jgi:hypothetical protein